MADLVYIKRQAVGEGDVNEDIAVKLITFRLESKAERVIEVSVGPEIRYGDDDVGLINVNLSEVDDRGVFP